MKEDRMQLRLAVPTDLPRIVAIYNAAIPGRMASADTDPVSVESRVTWFREHTPDSRPLLVMEDDGVVIGWAGLQSFYGRPAYRATAEVSVYVAPELQRRGIARRLLQEIIHRAPGLGVNTLLAFVFAHNLPSVTLFEAAGFQRWGLLPRVAVLDGIERDLCLLGRRVMPDAPPRSSGR
jgi:L-amino acid N-acyltransferase YncA